MKKRFAVIGYGGQGKWHVSQIQKSDVASLVGIYDIDEMKCALARAAGIYVYPSYDSVITDDSIDAVVIAVPNNVHKELVIKALSAKKHVICEKPVAITVAEFDEMKQAAIQYNQVFTVHQNRRFDVDYLAIKKLCNDKEIGEVIRVESRVFGSRGIPSDWRGKREFGGGMLYDWGVHLIDQVLCLFDSTVTSVFCKGVHITNQEVDDGFRLELSFDDQRSAYIEVGTYNFIALPRFYLQCSLGSAVIDKWTENAKVAKMKAWNEKEVLPVQTAAGITKTMAPRDELTINSYEVPRPIADVHDFYRNFCLAIDGEEKTMVTHEQIRRVLRVIETAFLSMEIGQQITTQI